MDELLEDSDEDDDYISPRKNKKLHNRSCTTHLTKRKSMPATRSPTLRKSKSNGVSSNNKKKSSKKKTTAVNSKRKIAKRKSVMLKKNKKTPKKKNNNKPKKVSSTSNTTTRKTTTMKLKSPKIGKLKSPRSNSLISPRTDKKMTFSQSLDDVSRIKLKFRQYNDLKIFIDLMQEYCPDTTFTTEEQGFVYDDI